MEIRWKNVVIALLVILALINLPTILHNLSSVTSTLTSSVSGSSTAGGSPDRYELARLCVYLIFILGVLRLLRGWRS